MIVHQTVTLEDGTKTWEALDDGNWAQMRVFQEQLPSKNGGSSRTIFRLVSHAENSPETSMDEKLELEGQWAVKDVDWVEFYKYTSMFPGGENDTIYGLAFANASQCEVTTKKIHNSLRLSWGGRGAGPGVGGGRPVSMAGLTRPESSKVLFNSKSSVGVAGEGASVKKEVTTVSKSKKQASYKTAPPPPPTDTPPRHKAESISLIPPEAPPSPGGPHAGGAESGGTAGVTLEAEAEAEAGVESGGNATVTLEAEAEAGVGTEENTAITFDPTPVVTFDTPQPPPPSPHKPQPAGGLVRGGSASERNSGSSRSGSVSVRVSSRRRPSGEEGSDGVIGIGSEGVIGLSGEGRVIGGGGEGSIVGSKLGRRKMSLASFGEVENAAMAATIVDLTEGEAISHDEAVANEMRKISSPKSSSRSVASAISQLTVAEEGQGMEEEGIGEDGGGKEEGLRAAVGDSGISLPTNVTKKIHVVYNEEKAHYEGLPDGAEWKVMNKQFGIPLGAVPKRTIPGYEEKIPAVLEMMKTHLLKDNGLKVVGIFRLAPDKDDCNWAKQQINEGEFSGCSDVNIIANLIKVFFRELPVALLNDFDDATICKVADMDPGQEVLDLVREVTSKKMDTRALIWWLFDLMSMVVLEEKVNKMTAKNMAIVISPNLYAVNSENPMVALTMSQKVADFCTVLLKSRLLVCWGG